MSVYYEIVFAFELLITYQTKPRKSIVHQAAQIPGGAVGEL